jgi:predicted DNA-binding transcriptional regulator AlpA
MATTQPIEPLLDVAAVMKILNLSRASVYRLIGSGDLVPVPLKVRAVRFRLDDVVALIEGR